MECIIWQKATNSSGYGVKRVGGRAGKIVYAHRLAWEAVNGPIPPGMQVHHVCRNKVCVNPDHMKLMTQEEHSGEHGRFTGAEQRDIISRVSAGESQRAVARSLGVSNSIICRLVNGNTRLKA